MSRVLDRNGWNKTGLKLAAKVGSGMGFLSLGMTPADTEMVVTSLKVLIIASTYCMCEVLDKCVLDRLADLQKKFYYCLFLKYLSLFLYLKG